MDDVYRVRPVAGPIVGAVRPPGSKSITNRALVCAALADGRSTLTGVLDSDDTRYMLAALQTLGFAMTVSDEGKTILLDGAGGRIPAIEADLFVGNSGTTIRFLTAMLTLGAGGFRLDGVARMRERPIEDLVAALNQLGARVRCEAENGCPPLWVHANGLPGGAASVRGDVSSQFLSGLMLAAPCAEAAVELTIDGVLVSVPYVEITRRVMSAFGAEASTGADYARIKVANTGYRAAHYGIEPDASAASYFWAAAAITGGRVTVQGLGADSIQGDVRFVDCLEQMGCRVESSDDSLTVEGASLRGIDVDMNGISDTVQTLGAVALFAEGPTTIRNVGHIRHKETDRIAALACELRRLGGMVEESETGLVIHPGPLRGAEVETYDDHRMAMSLALVGLRQKGVVIKDPGCTAKTYPNFFTDLEGIASGACPPV
ncbi:3-phosphoshikimate 1-carboxyvinyltransferase [Pirellulimonas nuda]|uniref:3-phosphoshikimate 1-carboxyvinyltransferase n=1 Tax=Pirellulimonas nuda TaxID=2528009 RepID=A0A518DB36_9BACT|nr:3-phosphoshikimate 1-carboxyvinyltransferase [Pirellulimonas nuda]QDU88697.1 3-phosphoshikimate 1-carboxyvinyltransferase [Pirellulimonas nuda]